MKSFVAIVASMFVASTVLAAEKSFTMEEVARHNTPESCWFVVNGKVYDVTGVDAKHPGGAKAIRSNCGTDATKAFETQGGRGKHSTKAKGYLDAKAIGTLAK
jgi:cytochrome b involved in lipid metabolism